MPCLKYKLYQLLVGNTVYTCTTHTQQLGSSQPKLLLTCFFANSHLSPGKQLTLKLKNYIQSNLWALQRHVYVSCK